MRRVALLAMLACLASAAHAESPVKFGQEESIKPLQDVRLESPNGEALFLAQKFVTYHFVLPAYLADQGYVLAVKNDPTRHYPLPANPQLAGMQRQGLLPDPLPRYQMTWMDYLLGYLLWPVLAVAVLLISVPVAISIRRKRRLALDPFYDL